MELVVSRRNNSYLKIEPIRCNKRQFYGLSTIRDGEHSRQETETAKAPASELVFQCCFFIKDALRSGIMGTWVLRIVQLFGYTDHAIAVFAPGSVLLNDSRNFGAHSAQAPVGVSLTKVPPGVFLTSSYAYTKGDSAGIFIILHVNHEEGAQGDSVIRRFVLSRGVVYLIYPLSTIGRCECTPRVSSLHAGHYGGMGGGTR